MEVVVQTHNHDDEQVSKDSDQIDAEKEAECEWQHSWIICQSRKKELQGICLISTLHDVDESDGNTELVKIQYPPSDTLAVLRNISKVNVRNVTFLTIFHSYLLLFLDVGWGKSVFKLFIQMLQLCIRSTENKNLT